MNSSEAVYQGLKHAGINFVASVPCINLRELLILTESDPDIMYVPVTREEEGFGICAGAYIGGMSPAIMMQNSGLGNSINALASLILLYRIPVLMIISHRGGPGENIVAQVPMGTLTPPLLETMDIPYFTPSVEEAESTIIDAWRLAQAKEVPVAVLLDIDFWRSG